MENNLPEHNVYLTVGIYPNGSFKVNHVQKEDLENHIEYNKFYRFGMALIVEGIVVYSGQVNKEVLENFLSQKYSQLQSQKQNKAVVPYQ